MRDYRLLTWMYVKSTFFCNWLFYLLETGGGKIKLKMEYETEMLKSSNKINRNYSDINRKMVTKYFQIIPKVALHEKQKISFK